MRSKVIISWGEASSYAFDLDEVQPMPHDVARAWMEQQFNELDCKPLRLSGKLLLADMVLAVAQEVGEGRFAADEYQPWAQEYARAVSSLLAKPVVHIDVPGLTVSY